MVILVVFNSFNVVKNLKKPDLAARQKPPFYTTSRSIANSPRMLTEINESGAIVKIRISVESDTFRYFSHLE